MSRPSIFVPKFIGTTSLGLLTGLSYTLTTLTLPPILSLPTATPAQTTFSHLRQLATRHTTALSTLSTTSLLLAYILSPKNAKHPYLIWASLASVAGFGGEIWGMLMGAKKDGEEEGLEASVGSEEWEGVGTEAGSGGVNGEVVREGMVRWRGKMLLKTGIWGVGWGVAMVGLWGDGF